MKPVLLVLVFALLVVPNASARLLKAMNQAELFTRHSENRALEKSGTPRLFTLLHEKTASSTEFQAAYSDLGRPQLERQADSVEGHFRVHYNTTGSDAPDQTDADGNGTPDFVDSTLVDLEYAWNIIMGLGYGRPRSDLGRGGSDAVDVYLQDLSVPQFYGYTSPDTGIMGMDSAYMVLDNNYTDRIYTTKGMPALRVTSAHELFHVFHYSYYGAEEAVWWMEHTAVWMEDYAWDDVNDYLSYLNAFLNDRDSPLDYYSTSYNSTYMYGASLFAFMLAKKHGPGVLRSIWSTIRDHQSGNIDQFNAIIPGGLSQALSDLGVWTYFTGSRANSGAFFKDSPLIRGSVTMSDTLAMIPAADSLSCRPRTFKYVEIAPPAGLSAGDSLNIDFTDRTGSLWKKQLILYNTGDDYLVQPIDGARYLLTVDRHFNKAVLVISNASPAGTGRLVYTLRHASGSEEIVAAFSLEQNHPNPFNKETTIRFTVPDTSPVKLRIYNIQGQMVRVLVDDIRERGTHSVVFNASDLSSGIYFARFESAGTVLTRKMMFLK